MGTRFISRARFISRVEHARFISKYQIYFMVYKSGSKIWYTNLDREYDNCIFYRAHIKYIQCLYHTPCTSR